MYISIDVIRYSPAHCLIYVCYFTQIVLCFTYERNHLGSVGTFFIAYIPAFSPFPVLNPRDGRNIYHPIPHPLPVTLYVLAPSLQPLLNLRLIH